MAIVTALMRTAIRVKFHRRLFIDDTFLIFACLTMTALLATVLYYTPTIFLAETIPNSQMQEGSTVPPASVNLGALTTRYRKAQFLRGSLAWLTIFAVKFSFLSSFRALTNRLPRIFMYWKVVVAVNILASVYCIGCGFLGCLKFGDETGQYLYGFQRMSQMTLTTL